LFLAPASQSHLDGFDSITVEEAAKHVSQCGLGAVTVRHDDELDEDVLIVSSAQSLTDEQLACADKAISYYTLELPANVQPRFDAIRAERMSAIFKEHARNWLSTHGLLSRLPEYHEGVTNDSVFAHEAESLCGPRAKGAFQSKFGPHAFSPTWVKREMYPLDKGDEVFTCLRCVTTVAGFNVGFVGNEYPN
jgi:hypothetical protein